MSMQKPEPLHKGTKYIQHSKSVQIIHFTRLLGYVYTSACSFCNA